ncbi:MAG: cobalt-precorrin-5B (C(1))-methyltransferase [Spirulina sp. DLM2.Bin59]|nr:MAG: cobalt-precorrin-5B (C(1))-methyltransferase [Spirulina sp. DLM2.Bin59]
METARSGYTLPVFAAAAAVAALRGLQQGESYERIPLNLIHPPESVEIPIEQMAPLGDGSVVAITRSDPGDNLDLTRNTPIWAVVRFSPTASAPITLIGGEGIGKQADQSAAIYAYAREVITTNLLNHLQPGERITVEIILPAGRQLATRTANAAFGVIEGLSLLGTTGISQPLSAPAQLAEYQETLAQQAAEFKTLVFCLGENGLDLARTLGINPAQLVKTANWLGPMLVAAAALGVESLLLFGYHGKLIKLAGGIFHTHHHLADGRLEILSAYGVRAGLGGDILREIVESATAEAGLQRLRQAGPAAVDAVYGLVVAGIDQRSRAYVEKQGYQAPRIGSVLFDGDRHPFSQSTTGAEILRELC